MRRHVESGHGNQVAFLWEGNDLGEDASFTYAQMLDKVQRMANVLKDLGVKKGDPVAIYLPMIIELPVAMLACARIGALHSVVFGGFSAESLAGRMLDMKCKVWWFALPILSSDCFRGALVMGSAICKFSRENCGKFTTLPSQFLSFIAALTVWGT